MASAPADSRDRMIASAIRLFSEHGLTATSVRDVVEHAGAPRGSVYHHFPGGKDQLAQEAVQSAGDRIGGLIDAALAQGPVAAVDMFAAAWRVGLERSDFRLGCPIVAVSVEAPDDPPVVLDAAAEVFAAWTGRFGAALRRAGVPRARAARLATLTVAAVEGAIVLCRARRDTAPLDDVSRELRETVAAALPERPS